MFEAFIIVCAVLIAYKMGSALAVLEYQWITGEEDK